jgi:hypothetical protein
MSSVKVASALVFLAVLTACGSGKSSAGATAQAGGAAPMGVATPDCHGETPVWAIERVKVYLLPDDPHFGRTKHGAYMCLSDAESQGYRHARGPLLHNRQHHRLFSQ